MMRVSWGTKARVRQVIGGAKMLWGTTKRENKMKIKTLTAFASVALCAAVGFGDGVESSNIVGYQQIAVNNGYQFFTVTFEDISDPTAFNLSDIKCTKADGSAWLRTGAPANACNGAIYIRKIDAEGAYGQKYIYYGKNASDTVAAGWFEGDRLSDGSNIVSGDAVTLKPGEGLIVYSGKSDGAAKFLVTGNVRLTAMSCDIGNGYSFGGNCTPSTLKLSDIGCTKADGSEWLRTGAPANACNGAVYIRKIDFEGAYGQKYIYYGKNTSDTFGPGWYVGDRLADGSNLVSGDSVTFAPGEGWIMYSGKASGAAKLVIPSAIK